MRCLRSISSTRVTRRRPSSPPNARDPKYPRPCQPSSPKSLYLAVLLRPVPTERLPPSGAHSQTSHISTLLFTLTTAKPDTAPLAFLMLLRAALNRRCFLCFLLSAHCPRVLFINSHQNFGVYFRFTLFFADLDYQPAFLSLFVAYDR